MHKCGLFLGLCLALLGCASKGTPPMVEQQNGPRQAVIQPDTATKPENSAERPGAPQAQSGAGQSLSFSELPGWLESDPRLALGAFRRSCMVFSREPAIAPTWKKVCDGAKQNFADAAAVRGYFEENFILQAQSKPNKKPGLLTAYYEPELDVRSAPEPGFMEPIYSRPADLVTVEPTRFGTNGVRGRALMGRVVDGRLVPYFTREEIKQKGGKALAWGSAVDVFFLQVQGSGRLRFKNGRTLRAAFAGHNGLAYTSIGRVLIKQGELKSGKASKRAIEKWMADAGPGKTSALMNHNKRYVFFAKQPAHDTGLGPKGTQGAPLTAGVSLAVDPQIYPLGSPVWVDTRLPKDGKDWKGERAQFLAIAQDTGGAINGIMRGDLFLGSGDQAGRRAGIVKHAARWWVLTPRALVGEASGPES